MTRRPRVIKWAKCQCGSKSCTRVHPTNLGMFYQGTGFEPHEVEWLEAAWKALNAVDPDTDLLPEGRHFGKLTADVTDIRESAKDGNFSFSIRLTVEGYNDVFYTVSGLMDTVIMVRRNMKLFTGRTVEIKCRHVPWKDDVILPAINIIWPTEGDE